MLNFVGLSLQKNQEKDDLKNIFFNLYLNSIFY